jgi:hypothetical protein
MRQIETQKSHLEIIQRRLMKLMEYSKYRKAAWNNHTAK